MAEPWLRAGAARLEFARTPGARPRTIVSRAQAASPVRVLTPQNPGPGAWAYIGTYGGGLLGGDATRADVDVGPGALAYLSTQSATKVFRSRDERHTQQEFYARVAEDAFLVLLPDPVSCFAGVRYRQQQRIMLAPSASLVMLDWVTSGRHARGERWAAESLNDNQVTVGETCILRDRLRISSGVGLGMNRMNCLATLVLLGPGTHAGAQAAHAALGRMPIRRGAPTQFGISPLGADGKGVFLRMAGPDVESVAAMLFPLLGFVAEVLGEAPWTRKW